MQEVWKVFRHWKVNKMGYFFAGVGDDRLLDTCPAIFKQSPKASNRRMIIMYLKKLENPYFPPSVIY